MDMVAVGARLGSSAVAPLVRRLFVRDGPGAGLVDRPVRLSALVSFRGEKRTLTERDLRKLATELVARGLDALGPHEGATLATERDALTTAVTTALHRLGDLDMDDVQAVRLGHRPLAQQLRNPTDHLSPHAEQFTTAVVEAACLHVLHFFTQRSTFVARTLLAHSRQLDQLITRADILIERLPARPAEDAAFEERYAEYVIGRHQRLTIFGLDLHQSAEWPLDTAYLSLAATRPEPRGTLPDPSEEHPSATPQPAERALAGHSRILLRGVAGSGKTTLVQWLAVTTARQDTGDGMTHLLGRVPFVLPLRTLTRGGKNLPTPDQFLTAVACPLTAAQPDGWTDRVLGNRRGLLLIDGVDEVPEAERERTRRWLRDLLTAYPGNLWLVTARPSAVRDDWLATDDFTELSLAPMNRGDIAAFIARWHRAAGADEESRRELLNLVRSRGDLARLATNPLMCGLLCALHRERRGHLPRGRKALYDAALSMLLHRRDRERDMLPRGGIDLDEETQQVLLQKVAYWLIRNGRSELDRADAVALLERVLPHLPFAAEQGTPETILQHLLVRSGLLREPAAGTLDFVHRTFQDYLGAREAVEERDFPLLIDHAHLDQWEDVVRMAVAHARSGERTRLLSDLIARGDREPEHRMRLHLLATACLEHATQLDPETRATIEERARTFLPPRTYQEAAALSRGGTVVLELLPGPEGLSDDEALGVVTTATTIATDAALPLLARYRDHPDPRVRRELAWSWSAFDTDTYAEEIVVPLARFDPTVQLSAGSPAELATLGRLGPHQRVRVSGDLPVADVVAATASDRTTHLRVHGNRHLTDLRLLTAYPGLEDLELHGCPDLRTLGPPSEVPLHGLFLWDLPGLTDWSALAHFTHLRKLALTRSTPWPGLDRLPAGAPLTHLWLPALFEDLAGIERWPTLRFLSLRSVSRPIASEEWWMVATLPALTELQVPDRMMFTLAACGQIFPGVTWLHLCDGWEVDLAWVAERFPSLQQLVLSRRGEIDLAPLAGLPDLREVTVTSHHTLSHREALPDRVRLTVDPMPRY